MRNKPVIHVSFLVRPRHDGDREKAVAEIKRGIIKEPPSDTRRQTVGWYWTTQLGNASFANENLKPKKPEHRCEWLVFAAATKNGSAQFYALPEISLTN